MTTHSQTPMIERVADLPALMRWLFPKARIEKAGAQMRIGDIDGAPGSSCIIWPEEGRWYDHETGESGDAIDAIRERYGLDGRGVFDWLKREGWLNPNAERSAPPPAPAPEPPRALHAAPANTTMPNGEAVARRCGLTPTGPVVFHAYRWEDGTIPMLVARIPTAEGKQPRRLSWSGTGWRLGGTESARAPLYRLPQLLAADSDRPVLIVEGEKTADAAAANPLLCDAARDDGQYGIYGAVVCPLGGSNPAPGTDWSPIDGRYVDVTGDADDAGSKFADRIAGYGANVIQPSEFHALIGGDGNPPSGWDIADGVEPAEVKT